MRNSRLVTAEEARGGPPASENPQSGSGTVPAQRGISCRKPQAAGRTEAQLCKAEKDKDTARRELLETRHALLELSAAKDRIEQQERGLLVSQLHRSSVYAFFHKAAHEEVRITAENWQELRAAIDAAYDDFTGRLYSLCPNLSEMELHICWLIKIQLSPKDMAQVVGRSQSAVSMARTRLYKKIHQKEGTTSDFDKFIADL